MTIIKTLKVRLPVEYSQLVLFDYYGDASVSDLDRPAAPDWVGCSGTGGAVFHASDQSIAAFVELELWSDRPAPDGARSGLPQFEGRFTADSGRVILASLTGSPSDVTVELPPSGSYVVRAVRLGFAVEVDDHQTEEWLLQVWPAPDTAQLGTSSR
jgi:hypothetical protein